MRNFDFIYQTLKQIDEIEKQNFIIYPFGEIGSISKSILNICFGIQEKFIIDDYMCENNLWIKDTNFLKTLDCNQYKVIFACNNESI